MDDPKDHPATKKSIEGETAADTADQDAPAQERAEKKRLDPTRYGDWEKDGRCIDF